jgi:hypothetical protein
LRELLINGRHARTDKASVSLIREDTPRHHGRGRRIGFDRGRAAASARERPRTRRGAWRPIEIERSPSGNSRSHGRPSPPRPCPSDDGARRFVIPRESGGRFSGVDRRTSRPRSRTVIPRRCGDRASA